jgi:hypothetical protein
MYRLLMLTDVGQFTAQKNPVKVTGFKIFLLDLSNLAG